MIASESDNGSATHGVAGGTGHPIVSILMGCYNVELTIGETVASVREQSFADWELICVDDGSTDRTAELLRDLERADPRIRIVSQARNVGLTKSLNAAIDAARGRYLARIDAGDLMMPSRLERQVAFLRSNPDHVLCGTQVDWVRDNEVVGHSSFATDFDGLLANLARRRGILLHPTIMFRNVGIRYDERFRYSQDLALYGQLLRYGKLACLPESLVACRIDPRGLTLSQKYLQRQYIQQAYRMLARGNEAGSAPLPIRDLEWERRLCAASMRHFTEYVERRSRGERSTRYLPALAMALAVYPPLLLDYFWKLVPDRRLIGAVRQFARARGDA